MTVTESKPWASLQAVCDCCGTARDLGYLSGSTIRALLTGLKLAIPCSAPGCGGTAGLTEAAFAGLAVTPRTRSAEQR